MFADFLQRFGALAAGARAEAETTAMARLFWFTVEFGPVRERGRTRISGSGVISSHGDAAKARGQGSRGVRSDATVRSRLLPSSFLPDGVTRYHVAPYSSTFCPPVSPRRVSTAS